MKKSDSHSTFAAKKHQMHPILLSIEALKTNVDILHINVDISRNVMQWQKSDPKSFEVVEARNENQTLGCIHLGVANKREFLVCVVVTIIMSRRIIDGDVLTECQTGTVVTQGVDVSQRRHKERRLLLLWHQLPSRRLTELQKHTDTCSS